MKAETRSNAYAISGRIANQSQSSPTGLYPVWRRARITTKTPYTTPATPQTPSANATFDSECQGALRIADTSSTAQKCTIVGVPNALISLAVLCFRDSAMRAITTNCNPVNAAPEEPTMT